MKQLSRLTLLALLAGLGLAGAVRAQDFPSRPLRFVVSLPPGNVYEAHFRMVATKMSERMGVAAVVENRPGGNGVPAVMAVMQAPADGYTVLGAVAQLTITQFLIKDAPYEVRRDLIPVAQIHYTPLVLTAQAGVPANNWSELFAYAKAQLKKLSYGGFSGGTSHLGAELLVLKGLNAVWVPYKDPSGPLLDLVGGRLDIISGGAFEQLTYIREGKLRPIMVLSNKRLPALPNIPTAVEATGDPELGFTTWMAGAVRAGTPKSVVDRLEREMVDAARSPDAQSFALKNALVPEVENSDGLRKIWEADLRRWERVIREARIAVN